MVRAETVGTHPRFIRMIGELIRERLDDHQPRLCSGRLAARPDFCPPDCCPLPQRPVVAQPTERR
jgi:ferrochelatase